MKVLSFLLLSFALMSSALAEIPTLQDASRDKRVVFLGESHTSEADHLGQLRALRRLAKNYQIHLVAEMFTPLGQGELESFHKAEAFQDFQGDFWQEQWGHPYALYRPIFVWAKNERVTLTHLRPDPALTREVKERGPSAAIKVIGEFFLGPAAYRDFMKEVAAEHFPVGTEVPESMVDSYFLVQCFWDEYMSWRITQIAQENPKKLIVVLVGHGHLHPEFGIPARLSRRAPELTSLRVGFQEKEDWNPDFVLSQQTSSRPR